MIAENCGIMSFLLKNLSEKSKFYRNLCSLEMCLYLFDNLSLLRSTKVLQILININLKAHAEFHGNLVKYHENEIFEI